MANGEIVVGLDIGTTKVCVIITRRNENDILEIIGVGVRPSTGMRKGVVNNIEATIKAITDAIEDAEKMCGWQVHACWIGIGGSHIEGINSRGVVAIAGRKHGSREICKDDIIRVVDAARAVVIPLDRQIVQTIPQSYIVDDHRDIKNPLGMIGVRLETEIHIITCSATSAENLRRCVNRAGFKANSSLLLLQVLAAGQSVLTPDEKDLGVALIDIGGGTTDVMVYCEGAPYSTFSIPLGGVEVTRDISTVNGISIEVAEKIKQEEASCWKPLLEDDNDIIVQRMPGQSPLRIPCVHLYNIVKTRMEEIFELVKQKLDCISLPRPLSGGIVITGGGAMLAGTIELASSVFKTAVRLGTPIRFEKLGGLIDEYRDPCYATAIGLVLEGVKQENIETPEQKTEYPVGQERRKKGTALSWFIGRLKDIF